MFTGLIEAVGHVTEREPAPGGVRLAVATVLAPDLSCGDSIAVNGVCLTVTGTGAGAFTAEAGPETLRVTTLGRLAAGAAVNLERPLRPDGRLGGHFVQGHVDAVGLIVCIVPDADFCWVGIEFPAELSAYLVTKGSIAVDGISLTVARLAGARFDVQIVPYTMDHTNLKAAQVGDPVNLETDMIGKYVVRAAELTAHRN